MNGLPKPRLPGRGPAARPGRLATEGTKQPVVKLILYQAKLRQVRCNRYGNSRAAAPLPRAHCRALLSGRRPWPVGRSDGDCRAARQTFTHVRFDGHFTDPGRTIDVRYLQRLPVGLSYPE